MTEGEVDNGPGSTEGRLEELTRRLERVERRVFPADRPLSQPQPQPPPQSAIRHAQPAARPEPVWPSPEPPRRDLEELVGGRVLAWVGSLAILVGILFLFGIAIDRGWIDESMRTLLGCLGSTSLLLAGVWLYERKGRTEAALAAVASALSGLYATLLVGSQLYELIPAAAGLAGAGLVGVVGVAIAVRWKSTVVAAIGILGALSAPLLAGAGTSSLSLGFMAIALTAAVGVLLWQRWAWLSLGAFAVSAPQLLIWLVDHYEDRLAVALGVLVGFWALYVVAAVGYELRARAADELPFDSWLLLLANVVLVTGAGYWVLVETGHPNGAVAWLLGLAASQILLGALTLRLAINREIGSLLVAVGMGLSAFAFADALDGPALVVGWAAQAVVLAFLATRANRGATANGSNAERLLLAAGGYLGLALGHALLFEAPPSAILNGVESLGDAVVALGACAAAALYGRFALRDLDPSVAEGCEVAGVTTLLYLASVTLVDTFGVTASGESRQAGQVLLSAFWTLSGLSAVVYGLLRDVKRLRLGGLVLLSLAVAKVYTYDLAALDQLSRVLSFVALGLLLLVGAFAYQRIRVGAADGSGEEAR